MLKAEAREPRNRCPAMALQVKSCQFNAHFGALRPPHVQKLPFLGRTMAVPLRRSYLGQIEAPGGRAGCVCLISLPFRGLA